MDSSPLPRRDLACRLNVDSHIDRHGAGVKEVQRPQIQGRACQVGSARGLGVDLTGIGRQCDAGMSGHTMLASLL